MDQMIFYQKHERVHNVNLIILLRNKMSPKPISPKGTLRQQQKEETRSIILDSARHIFARNGFEKTTIRAVAQRAGVGLGTIFNYFPNKQALLVASLLDDINQTMTHALQILPAETSIKEKLLHLSRAFFGYYAQNPSLSRTLIKESMFVDAEWAELLTQDRVNFVQFVTQLLEEAKTSGELGPKVNCHLAALSFFAHYIFVLVVALNETDPKPDDLDHQLRQLLDQTWEGIGRVETKD